MVFRRILEVWPIQRKCFFNMDNYTYLRIMMDESATSQLQKRAIPGEGGSLLFGKHQGGGVWLDMEKILTAKQKNPARPAEKKTFPLFLWSTS